MNHKLKLPTLFTLINDLYSDEHEYEQPLIDTKIIAFMEYEGLMQEWMNESYSSKYNDTPLRRFLDSLNRQDINADVAAMLWDEHLSERQPYDIEPEEMDADQAWRDRND